MMAASQAGVLMVIGLGSFLVLLSIAIELLLRWIGGDVSGTTRAVAYLAAAGTLAALTFALVRLFARVRTRQPMPLDAAVLLAPSIRQQAGEKAAGLCRLLRAGLPVPPGWVVLEAAQRRPSRLARRLKRGFRAIGASQAIVRSSFPGEDGGHLFPGIFASIGPVPLSDPTGLTQAVEGVLASLSGRIVERYRQRLSIAVPRPATGAVLVQEHVACQTTGVACSFHPVTRRIDEITVEADGAGVDIFCPLHGTWQVLASGLGPEVRSVLLRAVELGERFLGGPVVVEFGVSDGQPWIFQVRRAPAVDLVPVWTSGGPLGLNPEVLPPLHRDILYGSRLERLSDCVQRGLGLGRSAGDSLVRLHCGRPLVDYRVVAPTVRYGTRKLVFPQGLLVLLRDDHAARAEARAAGKARGDPVECVRRLATAQGRVQQAAENWRTVSRQAEAVLPSRVARAMAQRARGLDALRNPMHDELLRRLDAIADSRSDDAFLTLAEWSGVPGESPPAATLAARRGDLAREAALPAPFVVCDVPGSAPPRNACALGNGAAEFELVVLVPRSCRRHRRARRLRGS